MAKRVQRRRGTTAEHGSFTGAVGEISVDTTKDTVAVHDGSQAGGFPLAREDMNNVTNRVGITQLNCADGSANQFLKTNGSGTLSFATVDATSAAVGGDLSGTVGNAQLVANSVGTTELVTSAVTTAKIATNAITTVKINPSAITTERINDNAITSTKIAASQISSSHILDGTIVAGDIASNAVTSIKILDGNVTNAKIAEGAVSGGKIANATITANKMQGQTRGKILYSQANGGIAWLTAGGANTVLKSNGTDIAYGSITTADIANDAVTNAKMADDAIDSAQIANGAIDAAHIASNAVTSPKISAASITGAKIANDAVDSAHYVDGSIDLAHLASNCVDGTKIADDAINSEHYAAASIDAEHLATGKDGAHSLDATPNTDHTANGPQTSTHSAGYTTTIMDLVYLGSGNVWLETDADATGTSINLLGIALEVKNNSQSMNVALPGSFVRDNSWNWTPGLPLYISNTPGAITATKPTGSGDVVRTVGYAVASHSIYFNPSSDYITIA